MKTSQWITQAYGYAVCLVAVITFLISTGNVAEAILDVNDPLNSGWRSAGVPSLASFENYKMDVLKSYPSGESATAYHPDDQTLHSMYEAAKTYQMQYIKHQSDTSIVEHGIMILLVVVLFVIHWGWMRRLAKSGA